MDTSNPFAMSMEDFRKLGFKSGLEVHQQLATRQKLFCRCPVGYQHREHDAELLRHMRPTLSELGEYDGTALMEFKTKKQIHYQLFQDSVCTYEMDDTPPFPINQEALDVGLRVAQLFDCNLVDELHVTRKQYLDGSIPTGFQRTAIVGIDGALPLAAHPARVLQIGLEEDACREVRDEGHHVVFRTDRLSTPLVEVVTDASLQDPREVVEAAELIRRVLRSSERVRRGAGATRADVNVSVAGGTRVELKGVPRIAWFERLVRVEACRQRLLLDIRDQLKQRGVSQQRFQAVIRDVTELASKLRLATLRKAMKRGDVVLGVHLPGFGGLLDKPVQPGIPFAQEFAGRVRVIACLDEMPNLVHTDDAACWQDRERELKKLREAFGASHVDAVVLVWGPAEDAHTAADEVRLRALDAIQGVPSETRQVFADGTNDFERILPGPDRMYPDTDSPPVRIEAERVARLWAERPPRPWERLARYRELGLSSVLADDVLLQGPPSLFDRLLERTGARPVDLAVALAQRLVSLTRKGKRQGRPSEAALEALFRRLAEGRLAREALPELLASMDGEASVDALVARLAPTPAPGGEVSEVVERVATRELADCKATDAEARLRFAMGKAMEQLRGRTPGQALRAALAARLG
ncbi:MAG TPA: Glu-tRNA(Gln) amidotransferase subunit GatE [Myxococcota bacterium]|nr:Glu-tRNA(Gln) amidotransferase subunit GatE [Myxococcota bacterium]HRY95436.1 Glu-tRNA(Gln) amidotransferase subunit GatE [Myxococcota bacterium]HSA22419.1 Glu-tRNA(Gln) amidotransferase subunit GatE [Myxococcota bacterium]